MKETMKCLSCQKDIPIGAGFCPFCGALVEGAVVEPEGNTTVLGIDNSPYSQAPVAEPAVNPYVQEPAEQAFTAPEPQPAYQPFDEQTSVAEPVAPVFTAPEPQPLYQPPVSEPAAQAFTAPEPQPAYQPPVEQASPNSNEWICPNCSAKNDSNFCICCGTKRPAEEPAPAPAADYAQNQPEEFIPYYPIQPEPQPMPHQPVMQQPVTPQPAAPQSPVAQPMQPMMQQPGYAMQPMMQQMPSVPLKQLKTNRGLAKLFFLSLITFGIYGLCVMTNVSDDINVIASRYDGRKTMNYLLASLIISPITLGIYMWIWCHQISERIGTELCRRGIDYSFGAKDFWLWGVLGTLIIVGPFIYTHKFLKSMNLLAEDYNMRG